MILSFFFDDLSRELLLDLDMERDRDLERDRLSIGDRDLDFLPSL